MTLVSALPPNFDTASVEATVLEHYNLRVRVKPLVGDIGQNFLVSHGGDKNYIFKISNSFENRSTLEAQNAVLNHLATAVLSVTCPQVVPTTANEEIVTVTAPRGLEFTARLLTYVPGRFMAEMSDHSAPLLESAGAALGSLDRELQSVDHPGAHRYWHWDLATACDLRRHTNGIGDGHRRSLVEHFLLQFEINVVPEIPLLRKSIIHNDGNTHNLLVAPDENDRVCGVIDFGDMVFSCTVFELAIACAYAMLSKSDSIAAACAVIAGYHREFSLEEREVDLLYWMICGRLCQSVTIATYQQSLRPDDSYLTVSEQPVWQLLELMLGTNPEMVRRRFRGACAMADARETGRNTSSLLEARSRHLGPSLSTSYHEPLKIVRGAGQYLFDDSGRRYIDCVNNVCHVGHCHPHVVRALQNQAATLNTNTRYLHDNLARYVEALADRMPEGLDVCYLVNSGSEANELALRLARTATGRTHAVVLDHAYHGNTDQLVGLSHYKFAGPGGSGPGATTRTVPMPDVYRGRYKGKAAGARYARDAAADIDEMVGNGTAPAAFLVESLPGCGGQIVLPAGYLAEVFATVRSVGGLCIADEVQVGLGRVGSHFSAFETMDVVPDIVTLGKPIGNGHPLGAVICTRAVADAFANGMEYFNTFGGNPVSCAVGLAVLEVIEGEGLQQLADETGLYLLEQLETLRRHELVGDIRGLGMYIGIELVTDRTTLSPAAAEADRIVNDMKGRGLLLSTDGPLHNVIKIKPPLVFNRANSDELVQQLDEVLSRL